MRASRTDPTLWGDVKWFSGQLDLDIERLVFIDETWATTNMERKKGRVPQRRVAARPSSWPLENDDLCRRITADRGGTMVLDGPISSLWFRAYVDYSAAPSLSLPQAIPLRHVKPESSQEKFCATTGHHVVTKSLRATTFKTVCY
ncbi:hypothetical protein FEV16_07365 [Methylocystis sp. B8]|nr:hypothetical protein FEV16_07365 [Methylocystis sp. B8]